MVSLRLEHLAVVGVSVLLSTVIGVGGDRHLPHGHAS